MIVVDSSAVVAILFAEPKADRLLHCLSEADHSQRYISAVSYVETGTVLASRNRSGNPGQAIADLNTLLATASIDIHPVDIKQTHLAMRARIKYGRGFGSSAGLNFGDCFAYALAKRLRAPLLYVGDDFPATDLKSALPADR